MLANRLDAPQTSAVLDERARTGRAPMAAAPSVVWTHDLLNCWSPGRRDHEPAAEASAARTSVGGTRGAAAATAIASNGALQCRIAERTVADVDEDAVRITSLDAGFSRARAPRAPAPVRASGPRCQLRQHGRLVAGSGPDVQHLLVATQLRLVTDPRDDVRLGDRLPRPIGNAASSYARPRSSSGTKSSRGTRAIARARARPRCRGRAADARPSPSVTRQRPGRDPKCSSTAAMTSVLRSIGRSTPTEHGTKSRRDERAVAAAALVVRPPRSTNSQPSAAETSSSPAFGFASADQLRWSASGWSRIDASPSSASRSAAGRSPALPGAARDCSAVLESQRRPA